MSYRTGAVGVAAGLVLVLATACGSSSGGAGNTSAPEHRDAVLRVGEPIPPAGKDAVLDITGAIGVTNAGKTLTLDLETLETMPQLEATLYEPFLEKDVLFAGVLLSDLFRYAGAENASAVEMTALDDYHVTFSMEELQADRTLLATREQGSPIPIADGGPIRIVFLDDETQFAPITDNWIWSVRSMVLTGGR
ncbi:MAG: molybdopterin-dependent oxidoreductase [Actinomycetota bacterium]